ncbi:hypothetical protein Tco_1261769, partial [Tanacetum coccineum]
MSKSATEECRTTVVAEGLETVVMAVVGYGWEQRRSIFEPISISRYDSGGRVMGSCDDGSGR